MPPTLAYHVGTMWRSANPAGLSGNVDATDDSRTTPARRLQHRNPKHSPVEHGAGVYGFTDRFGGATAHQSNTARFVAPAQQPQLETEQTQPGHYDDHYEAKRMADRRNRRRQPTRYSSVQAYMEWNSNETAGASTTPSPAALLFHSQPRVTGYSVRHATGQAASLIDALQGIVPDAELSQVDASAAASGHGTPTRVAPTPTFRQRPPAFNSRGYSARTPVLRKPRDAQGGKSVASGPRPHAHHPRPATVGGHSQYARLVAPPRASKPSSASVRTRAILDNAKRMASATGRRNTAAAPVHYYVPAALASKKPHTPQVGAAVTPRSAAECGELDFKLKCVRRVNLVARWCRQSDSVTHACLPAEPTRCPRTGLKCSTRPCSMLSVPARQLTPALPPPTRGQTGLVRFWTLLPARSAPRSHRCGSRDRSAAVCGRWSWPRVSTPQAPLW